MEQIYQFRDWTSASRMKNSLNKRLKIDVGVIRTEDRDDIEGYSLTVYDRVTDTVVYKFYIDYGKESTWSLTTNEAIEVLNCIGFPCEFITEKIVVSSEVKKVLQALLDLGYTHIRKDSSDVYVSGKIKIKDPTAKQPETRLDLLTQYNYNDYWFLDTVPRTIKGILEDSE